MILWPRRLCYPWTSRHGRILRQQRRRSKSNTGSTSLRPSAWRKERTDLHTGYATAVETLLRGRWHERRRVRARVTCGCVHVWAPHRTRKARPPKIQGLLARCRSRGLKPKHVPAGPSSEILRRVSFRVTSLSRYRFSQRVYFEIAKELRISLSVVHFSLLRTY